MKLSEMQAISKVARQLEQAQGALETAQRDVQLLKDITTKRKNHAVNMSWNPTLILKRRGNYNPDITVSIEIPFGVVQQQLTSKVQKLKREIIRLENLPLPPTED